MTTRLGSLVLGLALVTMLGCDGPMDVAPDAGAVPTCPDVAFADVGPNGYCGMIKTGDGTAVPCSTACTTADAIADPVASPGGCSTTARRRRQDEGLAPAGQMAGPVVCFASAEKCSSVCH